MSGGGDGTRIGTALLRPGRELLGGMERCLDRSGVPGLLLMMVGLGIGWWIYVPVHELLHVAGCVVAGGSVSRLQIDPLYGGDLLAAWLPFVEAGGEYAGRLTGFDTRGRDLVYLATVLAPWIVSLGPGPWVTLRAGRAGGALLWGGSLPWALGPLLSLTGDALEAGGILVSRLPAWSEPPVRAWLRTDDLFRTLGETTPGGVGPWIGLGLAQLSGAALAIAGVLVGFSLARRLLAGGVDDGDQVPSSSSA